MRQRRLKRVTCRKKPSTVSGVFYDIEVEDTHCYFANGILVSNSHIKLAEPMPNPILESAILTLTGLTRDQFDKIIESKLGVTEDGKVVDRKEAKYFGGKAIEHLLSRINRDKEIDAILAKIETARGEELDKLVKKYKILRALKTANMQPTDYMLHYWPILPPIFRPFIISDSGDLLSEGLTAIYKGIAIDNEQLAALPQDFPEKDRGKIRAELYDGLRALVGLGGNPAAYGMEVPGILGLLHGSELKYGFFQKGLLKRRQDMSARGVITPDLDMPLDEVGIPKKVAKVLYEPFVIRTLMESPHSMKYSAAKEELERESELAMRVLEKEMEKRPVAMKRDPVLHQHGILGLRPVIVSGNSFRINPLTVTGWNADFDGDTMAMFVPVTDEAVEDVKRMMPSRILKAPTTGSLMFAPTLESLLGLYIASVFGKETSFKASSEDEIITAYLNGKLEQNAVVTLNGKKTTPGRVLIAKALPKDAMRETVLFDKDFVLNKKNLHKLLDNYTKNPEQYKAVVDALKSLGFINATHRGWSIRLSDYKVIKEERDKILAEADKKAKAIPADAKDRDAKLVDIYFNAAKQMEEAIQKITGFENRLVEAYKAGAKLKADTLRQVLAAPVLVLGGNGPIPVPIRHSYTEGLSLGEYWIAAFGARKSIYEKTQEVSLPGALNKQLSHLTIDTIVTEDDCKSDEGIELSIDDDLLDRYLGKPIKVGNVIYPANTLITSDVLARLKAAKVSKVTVRSPITCHAKKGVCKKCYGLSPAGKDLRIGDNVGIVAAQAFGERGVQLALSSFHQAGTAAGKSNLISNFQRVRQIVYMPEVLPDSAVLAEEEGTVTKIEPDPAGGYRVWIRDHDHYVPARRQLVVKVGTKVNKGDRLTDGVINPRDYLPLVGLKKTREYIANSLDEVYGKEGVRRIHSELMARNLANLAVVDDPGDHPSLVKGDAVSIQEAEYWNRNRDAKAKPVKYTPVLKGAEVLPLELVDDWLARLAYRRQAETLQRGVAEMAISKIHGTHPIPGIVYGAEFGKPKRPEEGPY